MDGFIGMPQEKWLTEPPPGLTGHTVRAGVRCQCCGGAGPNTHMVAAEGYAGVACQDCATLAKKLGGHATERKTVPNNSSSLGA